jgi:hypothetical protein
MQIIDLYIREGKKHTSEGNFPTNTRLVDTSTDFTTGNFRVGQLIKNLNSGTIGSITAIAPGGNANALDIDGGAFPNLAGQPYQIYDDYTKLELFKDESVSITDTIQNVKDPAKIFAPFSQQFSVPASKHNNKFFRHYYNSEIANSFDARFQGDGLIQLNGVTYKVGKLRLNSVELKNNVAYSYKLVFTGETIEFKEILAENELSSLIYPEALNFNYTNDFVKSKLQGSAEGDDLIFPLITHSKNMRYNYNNNPGYRDAITGTHLTFTDLKPAIKAKIILNAIQTTYPQIVFSQEFFNSSAFNRLYMWLHREEGYMSNAIEGGDVQTISTRFRSPGLNGDGANGEGYSFVSGSELRPAVVSRENDISISEDTWYGIFYRYKFFLTVNAPATTSYTVECRKSSNNSLMWSNDRTGNANLDWVFQLSDFSSSSWGSALVDFTINIITENTLGISQDLTVEYNRRYIGTGNNGELIATGVYQKSGVASQNIISINNQIPKIKTFDFLKNIFTMFNLTAYKEDGVITVLPLDDYYNAGKTYDITEYVDTSKKTVSKLLQFKNMRFNFKSKKSYLVQYSEELQGNIFSEESYGNDEFDGKDYKVEVDFEKMMYERLTDEDSSQLTTIVQGAMLDKKFEPTIGSPLLFYSYSTATNDALLFQNDDNTLTNINPYLRPSNSISNISTGFISLQLNFGIENDEYTLASGSTTQEISNDLFTKYYRNYVANIFAKNARKTNVSAYLPLSIILKYRLNDIFIIGTTQYRINSIKTNLLTNKSDLELYNLTENVSQLLSGQLGNLGRVGNLQTTSKTSSTINVQFDNITDANFERFEIYLDGEYIDFNLQGDVFYGFSGLDSNTTYKISLRAIYDIDGEDAGAFDTDLFETTL